jgi:hypothetical protein
MKALMKVAYGSGDTSIDVVPHPKTGKPVAKFNIYEATNHGPLGKDRGGKPVWFESEIPKSLRRKIVYEENELGHSADLTIPLAQAKKNKFLRGLLPTTYVTEWKDGSRSKPVLYSQYRGKL